MRGKGRKRGNAREKERERWREREREKDVSGKMEWGGTGRQAGVDRCRRTISRTRVHTYTTRDGRMEPRRPPVRVKLKG